jgi:crotonobetainyl-CoA:carnitine CoA-transferase CaiB-like acyl-CoA transferase
MQILGPAPDGASENRPAFALGADTTAIIRKVGSAREARALPRGCVVGDLHGGLTFTDAVAAALEARSVGGWQEINTPAGETWTIIIVDR